jgi:anthranilate/para-aminobenzoate synthase component I
MTKRDLEAVRNLKRQMTAKCAKLVRERKRNEFEAVVAKGKVETYGDVFAIYDKLSGRAKRYAAFVRIETLASLGYSPEKIFEIMESKSPSQKKDTHD